VLAFIARRIGVLFLILFGSSFILYNLAAIAGDPIGELRFSDDPEIQAQIRELEEFLNLDVPPPLRYFIWLRGVLGIFTGNLDLGLTRLRLPVSGEIATAMPITIRLVIFATIFAIFVGISLGIVTALRQYSRFDYSMTFFAFLLFSLPIFWVAVLLKQYLAIQFNTFFIRSSDNYLVESWNWSGWLPVLGLTSWFKAWKLLEGICNCLCGNICLPHLCR